jgi:phage-related protein
MFGNRPTGFYYARVNNQIDFETVVRGRPHRKFTVNFRCQPFLYLLNMPDIVLIAPGQVVNQGTVFAEPIITVEDGEAKIYEKVLGSEQRAMRRILDIAKRERTKNPPGDFWFGVAHGGPSSCRGPQTGLN